MEADISDEAICTSLHVAGTGSEKVLVSEKHTDK